MPLSYSYNETGIVSSTHCERNTTSTFGIIINATSYDASGWHGTTGYSTGTYPNGDPVTSIWLFGAIFYDLFAIEQKLEPRFTPR
jgi:hypothetical protein